MARGTIKQRIALDGADQVRASLDALGKSGEQAFGKIRTAGNAAGFDKTQKSAANLAASLDATGKSAQSLGQKLAGTFGNFGRDLGAAVNGVERLAVGFGAVAIKATVAIGGIAIAAQAAASKLADLGADAAVKIKDAADALGLTTDAYQRLAQRAEAAGVAQSDVEDAFKRIDKAATEAARTIGGFSTSTQTIDGATVRVIGYSKGLGEASAEGKRAAEIFKVLGLRLSDIAKASPEERINLITAALAKMPEGSNKAALALELLGNNWRKTLGFFTLGKGEIKDATDEFAASTRKLSEAQIEAGVAYRNAKNDLVDAVQATLKQIGLLFVPGATRRAEWLTKLVDDTRPAILAFAILVKLKGALFNAEVGGAKGLLSNALILMSAASKELATIWQSSLAPAAKVIHDLIGLVADQINRLLGTKFTAGQIEILTVVGYLVGAFGLLKLAITPILGLVGAFAALLVGLAPVLVPLSALFVAFWAEIQAGAQAAFGFISAKADEIRLGFQKLFAGDYKGAWAVFSKLGVEAFDAIKAASQTTIASLTDIFKSLRTAILFVRASLDLVANVINGLFGTKLTGATLGLYLAFFKMAGVLGVLAQVIPIVSGAINLLGSKFFILGTAAFVIYRLLPDITKLFEGLGQALTKAVNLDIIGAVKQIGTSFATLWTTLKDQSASTWVILAAGALVAAGRIRAAFAVFGTAGLLGPLIAGIRTGVVLALTALAGLIGWPVLLAAAFAALATALVVTFWTPIKAAATDAGAWIAQKFTDAIQALTTLFAGLAETLAPGWESIKTASAAAWQWVQDKATAAWTAIKALFSADAFVAFWEGLKTSAAAVWEAITKGFTDLGAAITKAFSDALDSIKNGWTQFAGTIASTVTTLIGGLRDLIGWFQQAGEAADRNLNSGDPSSSGTGFNFGSGFASGGHVRGPGTSRSDSIPAWLSDNEFVVQARAVRKYGVEFMRAINAGRFKMPKFANGGSVSPQTFKFGLPAFAGGGLATLGNPMRGVSLPRGPARSRGGGMVPVNIHIPGHGPVPMMASSSALQQIARAAGHKKLTTGGTKPSWYK